MNICVIGLGSMGKRRIRLLKGLLPDAAVVGADHNATRAQKVAQEYGIEVISHLTDIRIKPDCAFVCTSPESHARIIRECLEHGIHVFSEINLIDDMYDENIQMAQQKGKVLFLSSTPLYKEEMRIIDKKVRSSGAICGYRYHVGQYLPDWHPWDNLRDFFASSKKTNGCRELLALELPWIIHTFGKIERVNVIKRKLTDLKLEFPDTYFIQTEHKNGNVGSLVIDVASREAVREIEIFNETLYIRWGGTPDTLFEKNMVSGELEQILAGEYIHEQGYGAFINEYAYAKEIEDFFEAIKGKKPLYDFEKDKKVLKIIDEIEKW